MFDTIVVATDGSDSVGRAVDVAIELADRFDARVHALYVVDDVVDFADEVDANLVVTGTRGRHGEDRFLIGSVAETVVRTCPVPVLTVRRLTDEDPRRVTI